MFRKRKKEIVSETIFLPKKARVLLILQLCAAFTVLFWYGSIPFMGELFTSRSESLLYQFILGHPPIHLKEHQLDAYERNQNRFQALPLASQQDLLEQYQKLQKLANSSFLAKLSRSFAIMLVKIPPFVMAWICLSIILAILALKRIEGAHQALWLLPLVAFCYLIAQWATPLQRHPDETFFPTEYELLQEYLHEPLSESIFEQQKQLEQAWKIYLIQKWAGQNPSVQTAIIDDSLVEEGYYRFTLARLLANPRHFDREAFLKTKESLFFLLMYLLWNFYLAFKVNGEMKREQTEHSLDSNPSQARQFS